MQSVACIVARVRLLREQSTARRFERTNATCTSLACTIEAASRSTSVSVVRGANVARFSTEAFILVREIEHPSPMTASAMSLSIIRVRKNDEFVMVTPLRLTCVRSAKRNSHRSSTEPKRLARARLAAARLHLLSRMYARFSPWMSACGSCSALEPLPRSSCKISWRLIVYRVPVRLLRWSAVERSSTSSVSLALPLVASSASEVHMCSSNSSKLSAFICSRSIVSLGLSGFCTWRSSCSHFLHPIIMSHHTQWRRLLQSGTLFQSYPKLQGDRTSILS